MKRSWLVSFALLFCWTCLLAAPAKKGISFEGASGQTTFVKSPAAKAPAGMVTIGPMGYADAWRTIAPSYAKSIVSSKSGDSLMLLYSQYSGSGGTPSNLTFAYSTDEGQFWNNQTIVSNRSSRTYSALAADFFFTPYLIWADRITIAPWPICISYDSGGFTSGIWSTPVNLTDSGAFYLPTLSIFDDGSDFRLICSAVSSSVAFGGDAGIFMALTTDRSLGAWDPPWDISFPWGWKEWYTCPYDLGNADWIFSPSGDTVFAFWEEEDTITYNYRPMYRISTDGGINWGIANILTVSGSDANGHPYQYTDGGWWYRYDGCWAGDRPHLLYGHSDGVWNGLALFEYHPTMAGDFSQWTCTRISEIPGNLAGVTPGDLVGSYADYPSISYDQYGNIFATYVGYSQNSNTTTDIIGVASTDGGNTWLQHVYLTNSGATYDYSFVEAAEYTGGDKLHILAPPAAMDSLYYLTVPTATLLAAPARPREIDLPNLLCGTAEGGVGGPIDAVMDTVNNDTLHFIWGPMIGINGQYELTISKTPNWANAAGNYDYISWCNTNYTPPVIGLPQAGVVWYYKVRSHYGGENSPWSQVYDFFYNGTAINTIDWLSPSGVAGKPGTVVQPFVLNQNRPNPVSGNTAISFSLPRAGDYSLKVYNVAGQVVSIVNGRGDAGNNTVNWNSRAVSNGVYFYQLNAAGSTAVKKMVVIK